MCILITRPSPYGEQLVNQLHSIGKKAWHLPLINCIPINNSTLLKKQLKKLLNNDLIFAMSPTAIRHAHDQLSKLKISWPKKMFYYAIGHNTALQMYQVTKIKSILYPKKNETSEELLQLPELNNNINGRRALIVCGRGGRNILKTTLKKRGVKVTNYYSYYRMPILYNKEKQTQHLIQIGINTILVTSKEILKHLYNLPPENYRKQWLIKCKLIVISNRLAICANKLGWKNITITTEKTNNKNLINTLLEV